MTCVDLFPDCPTLRSVCRSASIGNQPLNLVCQRTCGDACTGTPLFCSSSSFLCQNGGTCVNQTGVSPTAFFGFQCNCPPGFTGELCEISK